VIPNDNRNRSPSAPVLSARKLQLPSAQHGGDSGEQPDSVQTHCSDCFVGAAAAAEVELVVNVDRSDAVDVTARALSGA
jgi:hypothetical protein